MRLRTVAFAKSASDDLNRLYDEIRAETSWQTAGRFIERIEFFCRSLDIASERGTRHDAIGSGIRSVGFKHSVTIVFEVDAREVNILRIYRAGRDWQREFGD